MKSADQVGITFANSVVARGLFNHNVNITLAAFQFTPTEDNKVNPDPVVTCRLRLDIVCAKQLRDHLTELLAHLEPDAASVGIDANGAAGTESLN